MFRPCQLCVSTLALVSIGGLLAFAAPQDHSRNPAPATKTSHEPPSIPGMSEADMAACMAAATPGPMHEFLAKGLGNWNGKVTQWMPGVPEPMKSECTSVVTSMMDGRFTKVEVTGDMGDMGTFKGFGIYGYDNVSGKFQSTWVDNMGTGMMVGTGTLSPDQKTLTWECTYNCPIKKAPVKMREVDRFTGDNTMTMQMFGPDPTTGKEMQMLEIQYTRAGSSRTASAPTSN